MQLRGSLKGDSSASICSLQTPVRGCSIACLNPAQVHMGSTARPSCVKAFIQVPDPLWCA
ncbi:hypothetical protein GCM10007108_12640 [Thermogymnomonas acidicola]|uniref:Uncharacterized protein n=1 Tax=Thermogymnomonas acidicola TaxID=399579 RepID=A0AA37BRU4_9ARCH|nr:hypothetical protein GCM10007108_12640 [Thermogymnomonas acidicola]